MALIHTELKTNNLRVEAVARDLKVNRSAVYQSLRGAGSRKIRVHIAQLLNKRPSELWKENDPYELALDDGLYNQLSAQAFALWQQMSA